MNTSRAVIASYSSLDEFWYGSLIDENGEVIEIEADALRAQYGTQVRPEELDATVEGPARDEARALQEATIAILEPVDRPADRIDSDTSSRSAKEAERERPRRRGRRGGRGRGGRTKKLEPGASD